MDQAVMDLVHRGVTSTTNYKRTDVMVGTIRRVDARGFGFIRGTDGKDRFFHATSCSNSPFDDLEEGQKVEFVDSYDEARGKTAADDVRVM